MAGNKQRFTYEINADIGQAKKAINDLQQSIEKLSKAQVNTNYLDKGINNAVAAAKELEHHLNVALNQNTGKLNLNAFTSSLEQSNVSAKDLMQTLLQGGSAGQQTFASLANAIAQSEVPLRRANKTLQDFATTLKNTVKWEISSTMVHGLESALSGAVSYAKNLNTSLTNIRIVTGQSVDDMARFAKEANVAAKALSTTTKSYADASLIYYQQGDSQELAAKKAAITIKAANSSFETSAKEMSEYLTAVWNSYQVGADELERYVDIMANLGAKTATSLEEIATSMQKVAATANTVGVSMEQVSSIIATVSSVTRESAESIGTSYKTIFARIGDLKLGKVDEDGVGLGQVSSQLDAIGVKILDGSGNLREMGDIIMDLGTKWQTMNQAQKTAVAQVVAGKRQYTQLMALFENWPMYMQNMQIAENSDGALQKMQDTYAESWEAASARVQASMEGIYNKVLNDEAIIKLTNGMADLIEGIDNVIEGFGGIGGVLTTLGGLGIRVFRTQLSSEINKVASNLKDFTSQFKGKNFIETGKILASGTAKSAEQIQWENKQAEWSGLIQQMSAANESEQVALDNSVSLLSAKEQLINAENKLTEAQKNRASFAISQLSEEQNRLLALTQEKEQLTKEIARTNRSAMSRAITGLVNEKAQEGQKVSSEWARKQIENRYSMYPGGYNQVLSNYRTNSRDLAAISEIKTSLSTNKDLKSSLSDIQELLGHHVKANFLDDSITDVNTLIQQLESLEKKLQSQNQKMYDKAGTDAAGNIIRDAFDTASQEGEERFNNDTQRRGVQKNIEGTKSLLKDLFDSNSEASKSLGTTLANIASTSMSIAGAFSDGATAMELLNSESVDFGQVLGVAASAASNLATSFASGGPIGLGLAVATMLVSGLLTHLRQIKQEYQDTQTKNFEETVKAAEEKDAELSNIQALMKNYNTLKETYDTTGEGQDALAASARALAEAYGLVGANVLIAEGNFKQFESLIARSSGLDVLSSFYQEKIDEATAEVYNKDKKSKYYDEGWLNNSRYLIETQYDAEGKAVGHTGQYTRDYYNQDEAQFSKEQLSELIPNPEELIEDYHQDTIAAAKQALLDSDDLFNQWDSMTNLVSSARQKGLSNLYVDGFTTSLGQHKNNFKNDIISLDPETYQDTLMSELYQYFDPEIFEMFQGNYEDDEAPSHLLAKFESMIQENEDGSLYIKESQLDEFLKATKKLKLQWLQDFADWGQQQVDELGEKFLESDSSAKAEYDAAIAERQNAIEEAKKGQELDYINEAYSQYAEIIGGPTDQNYFGTLVNEEGLLSYNDEGVDKVAWYQNYLRQKEAVHAEQEKIEQALASDSIKKGSLLHTILTNRLETVKLMAEDLDSLEDKDLTTLVKQIGAYEESAAKVKLINEAMADLIGKSEANTGFDAFSDAMDKIKSGIDASAKSYEELQKYLIVDKTSATGYAMNEDGTYKVKEDLKDSYNAVRDQIAAGFITDFTSFDDFLSIYQDLAAIFTGDKFDAVKNYINTAGIKDARLVNSRLINSMKQDLQGDSLSISEDTNKVLQFNKQELAAKDSIQAYKDFDKLASSYKDNLSYDDALALQQSLLKDGDIEWEAFVNMDADARKTYLESRKEASMAAAKLAQEQLAAAAREQQEQLYVTEEDYKDDKALVDAFFNDYEETEDGRYALKGHEGVYAATSYAERMEAMQAKTQDYESLGQVAEDADAAVAALELLDSNAERAVTKIERMRNAISKLPSDMEEFNKLVKQLGNIDPKELINMSDLDRAKLILEELEKPTEAKFTTWDAQTQENIFNAAGYAEAMQAYEEARQSAINVILESANAAFTQIENRMNNAREEAEKTKTIAETLSGAIETGKLTETQKLGMSQILIDDWGKASNATERAAIAAQQWANYGTEIANAGQEVADAYIMAGAALDKTIKDAKANNATDLLTFDFSNKETGKTDFGEFIQNIVTDPSLQAIWNKGFEDLISHTDISNMSDLDILEAVKAEIQKTGKVTQTEFDQILANVKDSIISMYSTLGEQEASLAQQVVNEWESAFKQIANLRRSIIMGEDIGSDLTASLQDYVKYANAYTGQGSLAEAYKSGSLTANQMSLGSSKGLTEKLLASMGLANDKWEVYEGDDGFLYQKQTKDYYDLFDSKNGETVLKGIDALAAQFNISKSDKDEATYEKAVREAVAPFIRNLLSQSDLDATTVDAKVNEFLNGSITAEETINQAANKMLGLAGEYATLLESNQQLAEADAQFKATQEKQTKIQTEAQNYANVTESIMGLKPEDRNVGKIAEVLSNAGISSTDYISSMQQKGFGVSSLNDIANLSNESLERYENYLQQDALKAGQTIVSAAREFKSIVTNSQEEGGLGYGEDSIAGETATKYLEEATNNQNSNIDAYVADTQIDMSSSIDTSLSMAGEQLGALQALDKVKQGTSEWSQGLDELYSAYSHLEGAGKIIDKLADGTINLNEANDQLVDLTLKATDNVYDFSDSQWDLYKKTLRTNKVVVDGYESLEDYFDAIEDGRKESKKWISEGKKFNKQLEDQKDNLDENKDGMLDYSEAADIVQKEWENLFKDGLIDEDTFEDGKRIMSEGVQGILDEANRIIDAHPEYDFTEGLRQAVLNYSGESAQCLADLAIMMGASADECLRLAAENSVVALQDLIVDMLGQGTLNWGNIPQLVAQINAWMAANGIAGKRLTSPSGGSRGGSGGGSRRPSSGGSGGGGSGDKKKEKKELIRYKDEIERYHVQNETLERISENLDEIDKLKERAYGKDHIAQIDAETDALNEQLIAQQALHDEALKWMAADKADLSVYGAEFNDEGTIINYETVMKHIIDEYNAAIERYNNSGQGDGDKLALEAAEQRFEDAKKAIENYEEAVQIANDSANEMLEIQNQISELEVKKITYELELKMEMNERDLEMLEYYQEKYSEELENQDKLFNTFIQSAAEYEDNLAQLGKAYEDLNRQYAAGLINAAHYAEAVTELQEEIVDNLNSLQEIQSELAEAYSETLELAREEIERTTDAIDHSNEALQSFMDITRLTGNDAEYKKIGKFYDQMYTNNLTKINIQKAHLDSLLEEEDRFQEKIRNGQQLTELEKAEYAALSEQIQETRDTLLSSVVESLEVVRESYENTINSIADDLDNFMAGAAGSMEYLQEQYGYFQEEQERYVSTSKELYEVSKLNRDIEGTLATTTSSAAKEALKALQEKINKQSELNELTEYDIEMNQLQYQLLLARIKLEESQNAKDTVRLTRDENGNYAYRYTANQDKIDEAAQHYEDVLQQINDTTVQRTSEIEQQLLNTMANYKEKFQEIATDYSLTEEERLMKLEELNNQFSETMRYLQEQNNIVTDNLTANQEAIAGHYGTTMSEITASTAGNVNDTIQSMIDKTEEYIAAMNNAIFGEEGAQSAWQKYLAQLGDIEGSADVAYDSLLGNAQEMGEMNGFAAEEALEVIQTLRDTLDPLEALSSAWDAHNAILEATISNYENLAQVIQGVLSAIGEIPNGGSTNVDGAHRYAKGGLVDYTGLAWVDGTASNPEMMLNPGDTQNILKATTMAKSLDSGFIGSLVESVKNAAAAMLHMFGGAYHAVTNVHTANDSALDQNVHITAEFPNVQNHTEIEEAFDNLINQAAQFAHRKN